MNEFICNWGNLVVVITVLCTALLLFISVKSVKYLLKKKKRRNIHTIFLLATNFITGFALVFTFLYMPVKIKLDNERIFVDQIKSGFFIPYNEIIEIRNYSKHDSQNTIRLFGSGGLFGYVGKFENPQIGNIQMYVTNSSNRILIRTKIDNYVISCENPDLFIDQVKRNLDIQ
jgi:hypothetical protein